MYDNQAVLEVSKPFLCLLVVKGKIDTEKELDNAHGAFFSASPVAFNSTSLSSSLM